ncbi:structural maintenance of chromosomes 5 isoform X3 [Megalopta genalis]|uniref:structural maintenance of chromosomes 5 isoform X3 n=1 Tax=Megalopta genalis TaxID=115081 RepID=UPI003FD59D49
MNEHFINLPQILFGGLIINISSRTYSKVAIKPGKYLNVIIGPNGTGKSTIVCAIVLGLAGKPSTIGRAVHVADYIKAGCQEAKIEIHLKNGKNSDVIITRLFNMQGKSSWFLDGKQSNIKEVQDLTRSFDIQMDNLCQFLPQDKVQDFSKMNAQELLENTERSVGDPVILERHKKLIQYRIDHKNFESEMASKKKLLESKTQRYEGLKESVSGIKERKMIKKKIVSLKQKKAWLLYDQKRRELLKLKNNREKAAAQVTTLESEMKPTMDLIEKLRSEIKTLQNSMANHNNKFSIKTTKLKKVMDDIVKYENMIKDCEVTCRHRVQTEEARDHDIEIEQQQKNKLDSDLTLILEDIGPEETVKRQREEALLNVEEQRNQISILTNKDSDLKREEERINLGIRESNVYSVNRSKYTGQKSIGMQPVHGSRMLSIVLDKPKLLKIEEKLKMLQENRSEIHKKISQIQDQICKHNTELDKHRANRNKHQQSLQQIQTLKTRISMAEKKIVNLQNERTSIDQIKESTTNEIKTLLNKQLQTYKTYNAELEECFKSITASEQTELAIKLQNRTLTMKVNESQDQRDNLKEAQENVRQLGIEMQPMKNEVQKMYKEALETTNNISPSDDAFAPINRIFSKLPPTIEEINNELNIAQAKVFCMGNNMDGENVLHEYETVEKEINYLKEFIQTRTHEMEVMSNQIEKLREEWLTLLSKIVDKINSNFSTYFSAMNCAGEVVLAAAENSMDFDQYGLKIRVKFRDMDQLQELTRHHQSGGERAVTTAIYMISLQELSRVPFRCVDEINQGMDALNERRVFNLLVQMTGRPNSSQYFLLTPKLLPDLRYSDTVTVHCVFNGPFMISHSEFDTQEYCDFVVRTMEKEDD